MISVQNTLCDFCGTCVSVCPHDAIELFEAQLQIDKIKCTVCELCVKVCPLRVLEVNRNEK